MRLRISGILFVFFATQANAAFYEVTKPKDMVNCMRTYILTWIVAPAKIRSWEHEPSYEFAGKYFHASWQSTNPIKPYESLDLLVGPGSDSPIICDYPTDSSGMPVVDLGFCKAKVENADVFFNYTFYKSDGQPVEARKKLARVIDSKVYCLNLTRP
jgi:hypothetical protein